MSIFNILFLVFWTFFLASATLEIISYNKKKLSMEYVAKPCMYSFLWISSLMVLIPHYPDSINIIIFLSIALLTGLAGACIHFLPKSRKNILISSALFVAGFFSCIKLISPSFRLFALTGWITLLIILFYAGIFALYYFLVLGKRNSVKTVAVCIYFAPLMVFHYGTILTAFGQPKLYSILLFIGSSIMVVSQALIVKGFFIKAGNKERLTRMIMYVAGQFFITAGYTLMVSF